MAFFSSAFFPPPPRLSSNFKPAVAPCIVCLSLRLGRGSWSFLPLPWALWDSAGRGRGCQISLNGELLTHAWRVLTPPPPARLCGISARSLNRSSQICSVWKRRGSVLQERDCFTSWRCKKKKKKRRWIWKTVTSRQSYHLHPAISPVCGWLIMFIILKTFSSYS